MECVDSPPLRHTSLGTWEALGLWDRSAAAGLRLFRPVVRHAQARQAPERTQSKPKKCAPRVVSGALPPFCLFFACCCRAPAPRAASRVPAQFFGSKGAEPAKPGGPALRSEDLQATVAMLSMDTRGTRRKRLGTRSRRFLLPARRCGPECDPFGRRRGRTRTRRSSSLLPGASGLGLGPLPHMLKPSLQGGFFALISIPTCSLLPPLITQQLQTSNLKHSKRIRGRDGFHRPGRAGSLHRGGLGHRRHR